MDSSSFRYFSRKKVFRYSVVLCAGLFVFGSQAAVINSRSCSQSDVQAAVKSASPGDTIALPAGSSTWSGSLTIDKTGLTLLGNGIGSTIISGGNLDIVLPGEKANNLRITRIEFHSSKQLIFARGSGTPQQAVKNLRVDNCKFVGVYIAIETNGGATGVFDHNIFLDTYGARLYGSNDMAPRPPYKLGTSDALFFEDNTMTVTSSGTPPHFIGSNSFSKYVIRHNTFNYAASLWDILDAHGACEVKGRGSATWEIYDNTFSLVKYIDRVIHLRGGQGVVFNNTFNNYKPSRPITLTDYAVCNPPCAVYCTTYPCPDMINHSYFWNNKIGTTPVDPVNSCSNFIHLDRDYFTYPMPDYTPYTYPHPLANPDGQKYVTGTKTLKAAVSKIDFTITPDAAGRQTQISYTLKDRSPVRISVYDIHGVLVKTLVSETQASGNHSVTWNAAGVTNGLYVLKTYVGGNYRSYKLMMR